MVFLHSILKVRKFQNQITLFTYFQNQIEILALFCSNSVNLESKNIFSQFSQKTNDLVGRSNFGKYFVRFLGESRTSIFAFEINWPLGQNIFVRFLEEVSKDKLICFWDFLTFKKRYLSEWAKYYGKKIKLTSDEIHWIKCLAMVMTQIVLVCICHFFKVHFLQQTTFACRNKRQT